MSKLSKPTNQPTNNYSKNSTKATTTKQPTILHKSPTHKFFKYDSDDDDFIDSIKEKNDYKKQLQKIKEKQPNKRKESSESEQDRYSQQ